MVEAHQAGRRDYSAPLWSLLMFESFHRQVVQGRTELNAHIEPLCKVIEVQPTAR
jgi:hypothetical protein